MSSFKCGTITHTNPTRVRFAGIRETDHPAIACTPVTLGDEVWCQLENHTVIVLGVLGGKQRVDLGNVTYSPGWGSTWFAVPQVSIMNGIVLISGGAIARTGGNLNVAAYSPVTVATLPSGCPPPRGIQGFAALHTYSAVQGRVNGNEIQFVPESAITLNTSAYVVISPIHYRI